MGLWIVGLLVAVPLLVVIAGQFGAFGGSPPAHLGAHDGRLAPPSSTPNSVSSQAALHPEHPQAAYAAIDPFPAAGDPAAAMRTLRDLIAAMSSCCRMPAPGWCTFARPRGWGGGTSV
ncbi:MAG: DUF1499 domain-containing protein [Ideonella sp.]|nr:DUF1499 domain-containing protein [Ideonella sp.]